MPTLKKVATVYSGFNEMREELSATGALDESAKNRNSGYSDDSGFIEDDNKDQSMTNITKFPVAIALNTEWQSELKIYVGCNFENVNELIAECGQSHDKEKYTKLHDAEKIHEFSKRTQKLREIDIFTGKKIIKSFIKIIDPLSIPLCNSGKIKKVEKEGTSIYVACVRKEDEKIDEIFQSFVKKSIERWEYEQIKGESQLSISFSKEGNSIEIRCEGTPPNVEKTRYIEQRSLKHSESAPAFSTTQLELPSLQ